MPQICVNAAQAAELWLILREPREINFRRGQAVGLRCATPGRIFSGVHPKAQSSRNSWPPKLVRNAAAILTPSAWAKLHEPFTVQYKDKKQKEIKRAKVTHMPLPHRISKLEKPNLKR